VCLHHAPHRVGLLGMAADSEIQLVEFALGDISAMRSWRKD
jgi:hypothetical protein